jgi:hypothetical protein
MSERRVRGVVSEISGLALDESAALLAPYGAHGPVSPIAGADLTGDGISSGWQHTLGGCEGDNNGAAGSRGPTSSGHIWRAMLAAHNARVERLCRRMQK